MTKETSRKVYRTADAETVRAWFQNGGAPDFETVATGNGVRIKAPADAMACIVRALDATVAGNRALDREQARHRREERRLASAMDTTVNAAIADARAAAVRAPLAAKPARRSDAAHSPITHANGTMVASIHH